MFANIARRLTQLLIDNQTIQQNDWDVYCFGIQQGMTIVLNLATTLLIGVLCGMVWQCIVFTIAYILLRSYAGGYHAKTPTRCYVFSIVLMTVVLLAIKHILLSCFVYGILLFISGITILFLSPVEDQNKPLDDKEKKVFRKNAYVIWIFELTFSIVAWLLHWQEFAICIMWVLTVMMCMLLFGKLKSIGTI